MKVSQKIALLLTGIELCELRQLMDEDLCLEKSIYDYKCQLEKVIENFLPSGSGFNYGYDIDFEESDQSQLVVNFHFQHITSNGYYVATTSHRLVVDFGLSEVEDIDIEDIDIEDIQQWNKQEEAWAIKEAMEEDIDIEDIERSNICIDCWKDFALDTFNVAFEQDITT